MRRKVLILQACRALLLGALMLSLPLPAEAQTYNDGMQAFQAGQFTKSRDIWEALATAGNPLAQYSLGKLYESGAGGVERDYARAAQWYQRSSDQGVLAAQNNLGLMYSQGRGVPRNTMRAVTLWTDAGSNGHAIAQFNLGLAYFRGEGVAENKDEAQTWFRRAADLGLSDAQYAMGEMARLGLIATPDPGEALGWFQLAAAQNHEQARSQAAEMTKKGVQPKAPPPVLDAESGKPIVSASNVSLAKPAEPAPRAQVSAVPQPSAALTPAQPDLPPPPSTNTGAPAITPVTQEPVVPNTAPVIAPSTALRSPTQITPPASTPTQTASSTVSAAPAITATPATPTTPAAAPQVAAQPAVPLKITKPAPQPALQPTPQPAPVVQTTPKPAPVIGGFGAWLISMDSEAAAKGFLRVSQELNPAFFADAPAVVVPVKHGGGRTFYRIVAGGAPSRAAAAAICRKLRASQPKAFCKIVAK